MKVKVTIDGEDCYLDLQQQHPPLAAYSLQGAVNASGEASVVEITPNTFAVLLGRHSYTVRVLPGNEGLEVWIAGRRRTVLITDARDRSAKERKTTASGPLEIRAQMPGKVVKILVELGASVQAGQGLIVIEAMKMQNEMKATRNGTISKIYAAEGATVVASEKLMLVE